MSKQLGLNPYLPFWETVPDGEPHVFDGRIYITEATISETELLL